MQQQPAWNVLIGPVPPKSQRFCFPVTYLLFYIESWLCICCMHLNASVSMVQHLADYILYRIDIISINHCRFITTRMMFDWPNMDITATGVHQTQIKKQNRYIFYQNETNIMLYTLECFTLDQS